MARGFKKNNFLNFICNYFQCDDKDKKPTVNLILNLLISEDYLTIQMEMSVYNRDNMFGSWESGKYIQPGHMWWL